jgi:hypothetical protein
LEPLINKFKLKKGTQVRLDKGYISKSNKEFLFENKPKSRIQYKEVKGKELIQS